VATHRPLITVGIPVRNRPELVRIALDSAIRQPLDDLEILVVDNASTDHTWDVLNAYRDPRLRLVRNETNVGLFGNFNRCIELASAPYVVTLCSDDALADGFLEPARRLLDARPDVAIVSSRGLATDEVNGISFGLGNALPAGIYAADDAVVAALWSLATYYHNPFNYPSGILVRAELARAAGGMDTTYGFASDVKLYLSILRRHGLAILEREGCRVLVHSGAQALSSLRDPRWVREIAELFEPHRDLLAARGLDAYTQHHLGGYMLGTTVRRTLDGNRDIAQVFRAEYRKRGYPLLPSLAALVHSLRLRATLKQKGAAATPVPVRPAPFPAGF